MEKLDFEILRVYGWLNRYFTTRKFPNVKKNTDETVQAMLIT